MRTGFTSVFARGISTMIHKPNRNNHLSERWSTNIHRHKARPWAVATPLCAASEPPNATGAGGRYRPSYSCQFSSSVDSRTASKQPNNFESQTQEEMKTWP